MESTSPFLFIDVDGPLNPYAAKPERRPPGYLTHRIRPDWWLARHPRRSTESVRLWLNPAHGAELLALPYELVWCTTWMGEANAWIAPPLGLPELPYVDWPELHQEDPDGLHWKTRYLTTWAAGRPFAWVDDELGPQDTEWLAVHHPAPALTLRIDPRTGLLPEHFATLTSWAAA